MSTTSSSDPFSILGVSNDASEAEIRARYLSLVKQYPPEKAPDKFRQIQAAFAAVKDPIALAERLVQPPGDEWQSWSDAIERVRSRPPRLSPAFLVSLGNRTPPLPGSVAGPSAEVNVDMTLRTDADHSEPRNE